MTCADFERWLDEGKPASGPDAARALEASAHAESCALCAQARRAAVEIEGMMSRATPQASPAFVDRVMARIEAEPRTVPAVPAPPSLLYPWWVRSAAEPASVLAFLLAALLAWRIDWVGAAVRLIAGVARSFASLVAPAGAAIAPAADHPAIGLGYLLVCALPLLWLSFVLYRWAERLAERRSGF